MEHDIHGLPISTSAQAGVEFTNTLIAYLGYSVKTPEYLAGTLEADPDFALAHCVKGYFNMLSYKQANAPAALDAARHARQRAAKVTSREQAHVTALEAWAGGDLERALEVWEGILGEHPTDVLALRLAHFNNFWLGRPQAMAASIEKVLPHWGRELRGYGTLLSCRSFALEECGEYADAEPPGRAAVELHPDDVWGTHAVAHIMEMQGRHEEGIDWLKRLEPNWVDKNNLVHHLWWHRALFHLEREEFGDVLALYDRSFRNLASPRTQAQPDLYIDVQNAASMLFRLERLGVDVGGRWIELADKAEQNIGDCLSTFTLPHWMMALAATGRDAAAARMLEAMRAFGVGGETVAPIVGRVAVPICEAVLAHRRGEHARVTSLMRPVLDEMYTLGASHAQQDVLEQLFLDSALKGEQIEDIRKALQRAAARNPVPPGKRVGYAAAAKLYLN